MWRRSKAWQKLQFLFSKKTKKSSSFKKITSWNLQKEKQKAISQPLLQTHIFLFYVIGDCCFKLLHYSFFGRTGQLPRKWRAWLWRKISLYLNPISTSCVSFGKSSHFSCLGLPFQKTEVNFTTRLEDKRLLKIMCVECGAQGPAPSRCSINGSWYYSHKQWSTEAHSSHQHF